MHVEGEQVLLRVCLRNTDKSGIASATDVLIERALGHGLGGGTVFTGILGLDVNGDLLETRRWSFVEHHPVIVEILDSASTIGTFLPVVEEVVHEGIVTLERAHVMLIRHADSSRDQAALRLNSPERAGSLFTVPNAEEPSVMKRSEEGQLLRVFIGESDTWNGEPLYRAIVMKAKELGLAGATVLRGGIGFGANSRVRSNKLVELSTDLPIVVELVDSAEKIESLLPFIDESVSEGLVTLEAVHILKYRHRDDKR
ncbi:MAG: DUF190 domain-containing protein [Planctomycetota bacterium]